MNYTLFPKRTRCRCQNIITPRIANAAAKSETEIITISTNFSFVSYDTDEGIFNVSLLDLDFCLEYLAFLELKVYFVPCCLNIAAVMNMCL